jgi:hypothetical protein
MALMPDEDFEGDFLEMQKNNHGITNASTLTESRDMKILRNGQNDSYVIATIDS